MARLMARLGTAVFPQPIGGAPTAPATELEEIPLHKVCQVAYRGALQHARELHALAPTDRAAFAHVEQPSVLPLVVLTPLQ